MASGMRCLPMVLLLLGSGFARGQGLAYNEHFVVLAPDQETASDVLGKASHFRRTIALNPG